jgi:hypothetical protein
VTRAGELAPHEVTEWSTWMKVKRMLIASSLAAGIGLAGLAGVGLGTASADPGHGCGAPDASVCRPALQPGDQPGPRPIDQRGIDQGRQDHRPFVYGGQEVNPVFDNDRGGWGFWFFNNWIPL